MGQTSGSAKGCGVFTLGRARDCSKKKQLSSVLEAVAVGEPKVGREEHDEDCGDGGSEGKRGRPGSGDDGSAECVGSALRRSREYY